MKKTKTIKNGQRIIGYVIQNDKGQFFYAIGRPCDNNKLTRCDSFDHGEEEIYNYYL